MEETNIEKLMYSIVNYIGIIPVNLSDYLMAIAIILVGILFLITIMNDGDALIGIIALSILIIGIPIYFNKIDNGTYLAQTNKIFNMNIGDGTEKSQKYNIRIYDNKIIIDRYGTYILDENKTTFYTNIYNQLDLNKYFIKYVKYDFLPTKINDIKKKENIIDADIANEISKFSRMALAQKEGELSDISKFLGLKITSWGCLDFNGTIASTLKITKIGNVGLYNNDDKKIINIKVFNK